VKPSGIAWDRRSTASRQGVAGALLSFVVLMLSLLPTHACAQSAQSTQSIESALSPGVVSNAHKKYEHDCSSCHVRFDRAAQDRLCMDCHKDVGQDVRAKTGYHGKKDQQLCRACHSEHRGRDQRLTEFDRKTFDHRATDYPLVDKHVNVDCAKCHLPNKRWREAPADCNSCHSKDDVHKGGLGRKCEECHKVVGWKEVDFDHGKKTRFSLLDKHAAAKCDSCHVNGHYKDTARTCIGCHRKEDDGKGHKGHYGEKCETCHNAKDWKHSTFHHDSDTRYVLKDKHRTVKCLACHTGPIYRTKTGTACVDCHLKDDKHEGSLGKKCESCHVEKGWKDPPHFDHAKTSFPLLGAHSKVLCKDCHRDQRYKDTPTQCIDCHRKDDKHQGNLGTACADCHGEVAWKPILKKFDHARTRFPLRGAHGVSTLKCDACHDSLTRYRGIAMDCLACHKKDDKHQGTLASDCSTCHTEANWRVERFDHRRAKFALTGRHQLVGCKSCHTSVRFRDAPSDCFSCHRKDDTHKATLGVRCESCHNDRGWSIWSFDHDRATRYPLEGRHKRVTCTDCHKIPAPAGKAIAPVATTCDACHRKDDIHEGRYGRRCEICHSPSGWGQLKRP
jgi:hypothetical protein